MRDLDKMQCVYCGKDSMFGKSKYVRLTPTGRKVDEVVLVCKEHYDNHKAMTLQYGRFTKDAL